MKFENLILIIIFAVYIVSIIFKKVRAASKVAKKETDRGRPEWKDKLDKFSVDDIIKLLGPGRMDESGDFTKGAGLNDEQITRLLNITGWDDPNSGAVGAAGGITIDNIQRLMGVSLPHTN